MDRNKIIKDALKSHFKGVEQRLDLLSMRVLADSDKWITVKPNGPDHTGKPVLLGEGGEIKGGMGGKFNGKNIGEARKSAVKSEPKKTPEAPQQKQETLIEKAKRAGVKGIREGMKESAIEKKLKIHEISNKGVRYIKAGKESGLPQYEGITDKNAKDFSEIIGEHPYSLDTRAWTVDVRGLKKNVESLVSSGLMEPSDTGYKHKLTPVGRELAKHIITV